MQLGELKPILTSLLLPPTGPLLLALLGLLWTRWKRAAGTTLAVFGIVLTLALSTNAVAVFLARNILPVVKPASLAQLAQVEAIVVLGGGVLPDSPEYGAWLAKRTGKPLAYAGGVGWGAVGLGHEPEGSVARRVLQEDFGIALRWMDDSSLDTQQNAQRLADVMRPDAIRRVAVVTDAWHIPRAVHYFQQAGFEVVPAPMGFPGPVERAVLEWLPSSLGLMTSRQVLREWLGLRIAGA